MSRAVERPKASIETSIPHNKSDVRMLHSLRVSAYLASCFSACRAACHCLEQAVIELWEDYFHNYAIPCAVSLCFGVCCGFVIFSAFQDPRVVEPGTYPRLTEVEQLEYEIAKLRSKNNYLVKAQDRTNPFDHPQLSTPEQAVRNRLWKEAVDITLCEKKAKADEQEAVEKSRSLLKTEQAGKPRKD